MNIFEKIQAVRVDLQKANLKMTGKNKGRGFAFFQLEDITPTLNMLMDKYKMTAIPSFTKDLATLRAINLEQVNEVYEITSPMGSANLAGCYEIQNIGAVETFQRRYLYQALFDINERDAVDEESPAVGKTAPVNRAANARQTSAHVSGRTEKINEILNATGLTMEDVEAFISAKSSGKCSTVDELNEEQFAYILKCLQSNADNTGGVQ